jgi:hypothetical protein
VTVRRLPLYELDKNFGSPDYHKNEHKRKLAYAFFWVIPPEESTPRSKHGESLKSRKRTLHTNIPQKRRYHLLL